MSDSAEAEANGSLPGQRGFEWKPEHSQVLRSISETALVSTPWEELRGMLMYQIAQTVSMLPLTLQRPKASSPSLEDPDGDITLNAGPQPPSPTQGQQQLKDDLQQQVWDSLDSFKTEAPFTVQRLAELAAHPSSHYATSIKYLRAIHRTLQVSSGTSAFVADTYSLVPLATNGLLGNIGMSGASTASPFAAFQQGGSASPLLSPIPWIAVSSAVSDGGEEHHSVDLSSSPHLSPINGHDASLAEGGSPSLPAVSPTGGRVDELDPLPPSQSAPQPTGMTDTPNAITDPQGSPPRPHQGSPEMSGSPPQRGNHSRLPSI